MLDRVNRILDAMLAHFEVRYGGVYPDTQTIEGGLDENPGDRLIERLEPLPSLNSP